MRDTEVLGAGDPGALDALFGAAGAVTAMDTAILAYRRDGWRIADVDPLGLRAVPSISQLDPATYALSADDLATMRRAYCGPIGWEIAHVSDPIRMEWLTTTAEELEDPVNASRKQALELIACSELLEATFDRRLPGAKTFGLAGCESFLVLMHAVMSSAADLGTSRCVIGGMHRGRLTQMALVLGKPLPRIIADASGTPEYPEALGASSDSPYHLGWQDSIDLPGGQMNVWLAPHPSHLSIVGPVAQGRARAFRIGGEDAMAMVLHTDAAFAGQGVNAEVLQLSGLPAFDIGGTVHLILNNQVGFTTDESDARTATSCSDVARMIGAPVLHINADRPDAALQAGRVAAAYRARFGADIILNLVGYRRKGHNEIDQPRFTQPAMYDAIDALPPLSQRFANELGQEPDLAQFQADLDHAFQRARQNLPNDVPDAPGLSADIEARMLAPVETGLGGDQISELLGHLTAVPHDLELHPKVIEFLDNRRHSFSRNAVDWATAEALAFGSLLDAGYPVRLGGQDTRRGAFSQRHLRLHDQNSMRVHDVLSGLDADAEIINTPLIENAVLAFEYGYSLGSQNCLTMWEAQFGDFLNVAQAIFDQFIICGEDRWLFQTNLVLSLPHGVDGGGPDHATAHPERLLAACARGNIQVINPSTPANGFHALRRQVIAPWRKPLVILAPKTLLRHPAARSTLAEFEGSFKPIIADIPENPRRIVFSCGKLAVLLAEAKQAESAHDVGLLRLEQLYPLPSEKISEIVASFPQAELVWAQEEPENFGYFTWLDRRLEAATGRRWRLVTRPASPSASSGPKSWDDAHLKNVLSEALGSDA